MTENEISNLVIGCAIKIHSQIGLGLLESAYEECLYYEILKSGLKAEKQRMLPLVYEEIKLECGYRIDIIVQDKVIIEVKAVEELKNIHLAQVLTYLRLSGCKLGLLMNFNVKQLKDGIRRVVNKL